LYTQKPWRFDKLPYIDYEKRLCYDVGRASENRTFAEVKNSSDFRELNHFLLKEYIKKPVDSVSITYALNEYVPQKKLYRLDTVFYYKYNPHSLDDAKK
jgi:hypothetical protein